MDDKPTGKLKKLCSNPLFNLAFFGSGFLSASGDGIDYVGEAIGRSIIHLFVFCIVAGLYLTIMGRLKSDDS